METKVKELLQQIVDHSSSLTGKYEGHKLVVALAKKALKELDIMTEEQRKLELQLQEEFEFADGDL